MMLKTRRGTGVSGLFLTRTAETLIPIDFFYVIIDEFFETEFFKSLYEDASLSTLFKTYSATC